MLFKLHYFLMASGANALGILLGVYMAEYTDATSGEIGLLFMLMPFIGMTFKPIICSMADRHQAHRKYLILFELIAALSFLPFVLIPFFGPQLYGAHPRLCWYLLVSFKVAGDIAWGGAISIADSLAINYATRIGTEFSTYRVWATVSWMIFGFITGHLNEIWFLPKYVAGFMIMIISSLLDALVCYLWPEEYFVMVTASTMKKENEQFKRQQLELGQAAGKEMKSSSKLTRSLMPRDVVWAHVKQKLWSLLTCGWCCSSRRATSQIELGERTDSDCGVKSKQKPDQKDESISKLVQFKTLLLLIQRDPRIFFYLIMFIGAGAGNMSISFFFMQLSDICHTENTCNFSKLGGYVQIAMASIESILFIHISSIVKKLGRLNTLTLTFGMAFCKFLFYATIWQDVNPHWAIVSEVITGIVYAFFLTIQVEMGHLFASEVEHLIPELIERKVIEDSDESGREKLKLSLAATMQALVSCANDGLGRGLAALAFGNIIDLYSYQMLWTIVTVGSFCAVVALQMALMFERCFHPKLGFDHLEVDQANENSGMRRNSDSATFQNGRRVSSTIGL